MSRARTSATGVGCSRGPVAEVPNEHFRRTSPRLLAALLCVARSSYAHAQPLGAEDNPPIEGTATPPTDTGPLPGSAWEALVERDVVLVGRDGSSFSGRVVAAKDGVVTVITADGRVTSMMQADVDEVRIAEPVKPVPATTSPPTSDDGGDRSVTNWARAGTIVGLSLTATSFGLAIGSEVTRDEQIPSLPLGASATVLFAAAVPVIMAGGRSARRHGGVRGNFGLRVGGWVVYSLALVDAAILVALGANEIEPPAGVITSVGILAVVSASLAAADALIADRQARGRSVAKRSGGFGFSVAPTNLGGRFTGAVAGVGGAF